MKDYQIHHGDCRDELKSLADCSVDSVVTDPPYELNFMSKGWDRSGIAYDVSVWRECLRVLKPGGHLLAFGGSRTYHRLACAIEDAGFEIRDQIQWIYGSGFPKSLDISKQIDSRGGVAVGWFGPWLRAWRAERGISQAEVASLFPSKNGGQTGCVANWELGFNMPTAEQFNLICATYGLPFRSLAEAEREITGAGKSGKTAIWNAAGGMGDFDLTAPATDAAKQWNGWGTALKPAHEPIVLARKPLIGTVAENILQHGTGGLNIAATRIKSETLPPVAFAYTPQSRGGALVDTFAFVLPRLQGELQRIASVLRSCSTGGIFPSRDADALDGKSPVAFECEPVLARLYPNGVWCGLNLLVTEDSEDGCLSCRRSCDALFRRAQVCAQESPALLADALVDICRGLPELARNHEYQSNGRPSSCDALTLVSAFVSQLSGNTIPDIQPAREQPLGRWPSNVILDGSDEVLAGFPDVAAGVAVNRNRGERIPSTVNYASHNGQDVGFGDSGSAARFFYAAKASKEDREDGLESLPLRSAGEVTDRQDGSEGLNSPRAGAGRTNGSRNHHPCVKPTDLMRYLCRLVTPPNGTVLDPFCGSGSTGRAAILEGLNFIGIELNEEYCELAEKRIEAVTRQGMLMFA